jgi:hypothetical protein
MTLKRAKHAYLHENKSRNAELSCQKSLLIPTGLRKTRYAKSTIHMKNFISPEQ